MVDNRSQIYNVAAFNFKQGDASSMANAMTDEKNGQGAEYFAQENAEEENNAGKINSSEYVDRSAQLTGTLDSLARLNAASVTRIKKEMDKKLKDKIKEKAKKKNQKNLGHLIDDYEKK